MKDYPEGLAQAECDVMWYFARRLADEASMFPYFAAWLRDDESISMAAHYGLTPERVQKLYKMSLTWMDIPPEDCLPPGRSAP